MNAHSRNFVNDTKLCLHNGIDTKMWAKEQ